MPAAHERITVSQDIRTIDKRNPVSGHEWTEQELINKWTARTPTYSQSFSSKKGAEKYAEEQRETYKEFPFKIPMSQREVDRCNKLGIKIDWEMYELKEV